MLARVSHIEAYRRWRAWRPLHDDDDDEEPTLEEFVRSLTLNEPSPAMLAGTAFHKAMETAVEGEHDLLTADGYTFHFDDASIALPAVRELRVSKAYGDLTVTGKADGLVGRMVIDHKTTSKFVADNYFEGVQWRFYLDLFGADLFQWNVFVIRERDPNVFTVAAPQVLVAHRYPELHRDCADLAEEYLAFARAHLPADFNPLAHEADE